MWTDSSIDATLLDKSIDPFTQYTPLNDSLSFFYPLSQALAFLRTGLPTFGLAAFTGPSSSSAPNRASRAVSRAASSSSSVKLLTFSKESHLVFLFLSHDIFLLSWSGPLPLFSSLQRDSFSDASRAPAGTRCFDTPFGRSTTPAARPPRIVSPI